MTAPASGVPLPEPAVGTPPLTWGRVALHVGLLATAALTTTIAGAFWEGFDPLSDPRLLPHGISFAATLIAILLVHESGHYFMCRWHGMQASLPYFLPAPPQLLLPPGTFGAFIRVRSRFPNRSALFDMGAAGPWAGFVVAVVAILVGLSRSTVLASPQEGHGVSFGDSLLTSFLIRAILHADSDAVVLHPIAFAGWWGLFVTSINLLPVGQLDGGHVLYAVAGRTPFVSALVIAFLIWLGVHGTTGWLVLAGLLTAFLALGHPPTEDDARPLDLPRRLAAWATLAVLVLTFVAEPFRFLP